ncbi:MAG: hypothetical protein QNJ98_17325 [Planctomycetota bacterium]|nr:hypothetical protein [Planctomycetota bacterium]
MRYLVPILLALVFAAPAAEAGERSAKQIQRGKQAQGLIGVYPSRSVKQEQPKNAEGIYPPRSVKPNQPKGFGYDFAPRGLKIPETGRAKQAKKPNQFLPDMDAPRSAKGSQAKGLFPSRNLKLPETGRAKRGSQPTRILPDMLAPKGVKNGQPMGLFPSRNLKLGDKGGHGKRPYITLGDDIYDAKLKAAR